MAQRSFQSLAVLELLRWWQFSAAPAVVQVGGQDSLTGVKAFNGFQNPSTSRSFVRTACEFKLSLFWGWTVIRSPTMLCPVVLLTLIEHLYVNGVASHESSNRFFCDFVFDKSPSSNLKM